MKKEKKITERVTKQRYSNGKNVAYIRVGMQMR
jgi:hypothetical protein